MRSIYHIVSKSELDALAESGVYAPSSIEAEGFIHCSYPEQVCRVANHLYRGQADLVLLEIDRQRTECEVIDEDLYGLNELYPHIYGPLPRAAIIAIHEFNCSDKGDYSLPRSIKSQ